MEDSSQNFCFPYSKAKHSEKSLFRGTSPSGGATFHRHVGLEFGLRSGWQCEGSGGGGKLGSGGRGKANELPARLFT